MAEPLEAQPSLDDKLVDRYYQAIGRIEGTIIPSETLKIRIGDRLFPISCPPWLKDKLTSGQSQIFWVYPKISREGLYFKIVFVPQPAENELFFILKGCWKTTPCGDRLTVYRNPNPRQSKKYKPIVLPLIWENAPGACHLLHRKIGYNW